MNRPLIVGQAPSKGSNPREPLSGKSGKRLAALCGLEHGEFLDVFERVNLLDYYPGPGKTKGDRFDKLAARFSACAMTPRLRQRRTVLLGLRVANAFHFSHPMFRWIDEIGDGALVAYCPHPSSVSQWWNEPRRVDVARGFWQELTLEALSQR